METRGARPTARGDCLSEEEAHGSPSCFVAVFPTRNVSRAYNTNTYRRTMRNTRVKLFGSFSRRFTTVARRAREIVGLCIRPTMRDDPNDTFNSVRLTGGHCNTRRHLSRERKKRERNREPLRDEKQSLAHLGRADAPIAHVEFGWDLTTHSARLDSMGNEKRVVSRTLENSVKILPHSVALLLQNFYQYKPLRAPRSRWRRGTILY